MDSVTQIKEKLNIVDFIGGYVQLKKAGKNYKGLCPFHKEKSGSFIVSEDIQRYKCFGCGKNGDIFNFVMEQEGLDFSEALKTLAEKAGVELVFDSNGIDKKDNINKLNLKKINETTANFYHQLLTNHEFGKFALLYLKKRRINIDTINEFKIGYAPNSWGSLSKALIQKGFKAEDMDKAGVARFRKSGNDTYDLFRGRLIFPLVDHLNVFVGFGGRALQKDQVPKYLNTPETPLYHKEKFLYGLFNAKKHIKEKDFVIVVEGYFDMVSLFQNGYKNVVASSGTAFTSAHLALIKKYTDNITLLLDGDSAGVQATLRGIDIVQNSGLNMKVAVMPPQYKDPDEMMEKDADAFQNVLDNALPFMDYYFSYASQNYNFDDVFDRKRAYAFILDKIKRISDDIMKNHYIKKAAVVFDSSEEAVINELKKQSQPKDLWAASKPEVQVQNNNISDKKEVLNPELYLLYLLLHAGSKDLDNYLDRIKPEFFVSDGVRDLFQKFCEEYSSSEESIDIRAFYDKLPAYNPDIHKMFENIYLVDISTNLDDSELFAKEFQTTLDRVYKSFLHRKINHMSKEMTKAEAANDSDLFKKLQAEASNYINQLKTFN